MPLTTQSRDRLRLLLAATGVAIVLLAVVWASLVWIPERYLDSVLSKWARFIVVSTFFVGYCVKTYWHARKHLLFWILLLCVLILHFLVVGYFWFVGEG